MGPTTGLRSSTRSDFLDVEELDAIMTANRGGL